jgi:general secretion pathway protein F
MTLSIRNPFEYFRRGVNSQSESTWRLSRFWHLNPGKNERQSLLRVLAMAYEPKALHQRPSPSALLELYALEERGRQRRRVRRLSARLAEGLSLADALEQTPDLVTDAQLLAIRIASHSGMLSPVLEQLIESERQPLDSFHEQRFDWIYLSALAVVFCLLITVIKALVFPALGSIMTELGMAHPLLFELANSNALGVVVIVAPLLLLGVPVVEWLTCRFGALRRIRHRLGSFLSTRRYMSNVALALKLLAKSMQVGRPAAATLSTLAKYHHDARVRHQLLQARNDMELGTAWPDSFEQAGLLTSEMAAAMNLLESNADRGWLLNGLADRQLLKLAHRHTMLQSIWQTLVVLFFGFIALVFCMGVIVFLANSINALA